MSLSTRLRRQIAELDRKVRAPVQALETGIEPELVSERIAELRGGKQALQDALVEIGTESQEAEDEELNAQLASLPDLGQALREAPPRSSARYSPHSTCRSRTTRSSDVSNSRQACPRPS